MRDWWLGLAPRERQAVLAGAVVLVVLLVYGGLWAPLAAERERQAERRAALLADLQWMRQAAAEVRALRGAGAERRNRGDGGRSLLAQVDISTQAAGIEDSIGGIQPEEGERVGVTLEGAGFDALMRWLGWLKGEGVDVASLSLRRIDRSPNVDGRVVLVRGD